MPSIELTERLLYLRTVPAVKGLPPDELGVLAEAAEECFFRGGEAIMRESDPVDATHIVVDGRVRVARGGHELGIVRGPRSVGHIGMLAQGEGGFDITAVEPTRTLRIGREKFFELYEEHFSLYLSTLEVVSKLIDHELRIMPNEGALKPLGDVHVEVPSGALDLVQRMFFLRRMGPLASAGVNAVAELAQHLTEKRLAAGTKIWSIGDPSDENLLVVSGCVSCTDERGTLRLRFTPGSAIGGVEARARVGRRHDAWAETDVVLLVLGSTTMLDMMEDNPPLALSFMSRIARALLEAWDRRAATGVHVLEEEQIPDPVRVEITPESNVWRF